MTGKALEKSEKALKKCLKDYQYHLKDHLGNVRTTFAVRDDDYPTDFETASNPYFDNYDQITKLTSALKRSGNNSHRLAGGSNETVGLMKSLLVSKGDKVKAEVYGKYIAATNQDDAINTGALITALVNMLSGGAVTGEGNIVSDNLTSGYTSAAIADNSNEQSPRAYLNYIMLDKDFNYLNSGFDRLSTSAADPGDGSGMHQKLSFEEILIDQDGYLMVFLSNESQQTVEVFWDDFRVDHHHNAVIQASDYFPFGLTFNSYTRNYSKANNYLYNQGTGEKTFKTERVPELGVDFTKFRVYDPALGRFWQVDPMADAAGQESWNPYHYSFNNPIRYNDPFGDCPPGTICDKYVPSASVMTKLSAAKQSFSKILDGSVSLSGKLYGAGGKAQVGPLQLKGSASAVSVSGKASPNGLEIGAKGLSASGEAGFASVSVKTSVSAIEGKVTANNEGVNVSGDAFKEPTLKGTVGENGMEFTADNSAKVGVGVQVSVVKVEASVNVGEAVKGMASFIEAGLEYTFDVMSKEMESIQNSIDF
ncbi:hypothetical protein GCM10011506_40330 [Marivirga lumbricoides]|uniref:RHS repeat-associated core domain-containing protein n=1 Tax=Marivirga lumbricoides TaxID=1046115 RepID=A0ABQ1N148_9BACT|nr:hypothetical protein GCM10011506_40330 [Marivirga lumbricoides]